MKTNFLKDKIKDLLAKIRSHPLTIKGSETYKNYPQLSLLGFVAAAALVTSLMNVKKQTDVVALDGADSETIDTLVPYGHNLIPITLANAESLQSVMGAFGVADIYEPEAKAPLVSNVKIIRSGSDLMEFAILVKSELSNRVIKASQLPLLAIIKNPNHQKNISQFNSYRTIKKGESHETNKIEK